jgi:hypothetical protein
MTLETELVSMYYTMAERVEVEFTEDKQLFVRIDGKRVFHIQHYYKAILKGEPNG